MVKRRHDEEKEPTLAAGLYDHEELGKPATEEEIARDDYTNVTTLSYDEVDPSEVKHK